jgi:hypothetical protein
MTGRVHIVCPSRPLCAFACTAWQVILNFEALSLDALTLKRDNEELMYSRYRVVALLGAPC